ncbi:MAG: signal peptidase I [ANME-2 cluster archaeon]|nr:signal peptidase I [ANME-2 cluster archaeon]
MNILIAYMLLSHILLFAAVMTGSMTGTVNKGDLILMTSVGDIEVGDIIMFDPPQLPYPVTHRVYDITPIGIKTKGDARNEPDSWTIQEEDILSRAIILFEKPIVIPDVGNYFIVGDEFEQKSTINTDYGDEYGIAKKLFAMVRSYGVVIFILVLLYSVLDIFKGG